jgi:hypothetical protein
MPIVNSIYKRKTLFASEFFCPNCLTIRPYELRPMSREIVLTAIPFLDADEPAHVVECQFCRKAFDPEILARTVQSLFRLAGAAKHQLDTGISPGFLKLQLMSDGLQESFADRLISLAQH